MAWYAYLMELGLSKHDVVLLELCPIGAAVGSWANIGLMRLDPYRFPGAKDARFARPRTAVVRLGWMVNRIMLGALLGGLLALYFVGTLQPNVTTIAKLTALSVLIGYAAPKIWLAQERVVTENVVARLEDALRRGGNNVEIGAAIQPSAPGSE